MNWEMAASSHETAPSPDRGLLRVCVIGPESTGKTTLACQLARHYDAFWVREYARLYSADKLALGHGRWWPEEFVHIARTQRHLEAEAEREANSLLFFDTDAFAVWVWHRLYAEQPSKALEALVETLRADFYLLAAPDIPFVDDGIRDRSIPREWMYRLYRGELERTGRRFVEISGTRDARLAAAVAAVNELAVRERVREHR